MDNIKKVKMSFKGRFVETPRRGVWMNLPEDIRDLLEKEDSTLRGITERLHLNQKYTITISIKSKE